MKSIAYIHVGCVGEYVYKEHKDWAAMDEKGRPKSPRWGLPEGESYHICLLSPYQDFVLKLTEEIVGSYHPDAFYIGGPTYIDQCYCPRCKEDFRNKTGYNLPCYWPPKEKDSDKWLLTLVNFTGDAKHRTDPITEVIPLKDITLRLKSKEHPQNVELMGKDRLFYTE